MAAHGTQQVYGMVWIHSYPSVELTKHLWTPQCISYDMVGYIRASSISKTLPMAPLGAVLVIGGVLLGGLLAITHSNRRL